MTPPDDFNTFLFSRLFLHKDRIRLLGQAFGPGVIANAVVSVLPIPNQGNCAEGGEINSDRKVLTSGKTNQYGQFSLAYISLGSPVCIVVTGNSDAYMSLYVPFSNETKNIPWQDNIHFSTVIVEPNLFNASRGVDGLYKIVNVSPFTTIVEGRFQGLRNSNQDSITSNIERANRDVLVSFFNGLSGNIEELDTASEIFRMRTGGLAQISDSGGDEDPSSSSSSANGFITFTDIFNMVNFIKDDFSDGIFNGKKVDLSGTTSSITFLTYTTNDFSSFLSVKFKYAVKHFLDFLAAEDLPSILIDEQTFCDNSFDC
jgi:hypothetical protein